MNPAVAPPPASAPGPPASPPSVAGPIRPFTAEDIPAVVALRRQLFRHTTRPGTHELATFLARVFLANPWRDLDLPSLVHLDEAGEVCGFVGIVPRRLRFEGQAIRVAVATQLMMRPGAPLGSGLRLVRTVFEGPQDLTLSDAANEAARRLWQRVGGTTALPYSLYWTLPLRPARHALARFATSPARRALAFLLRPACALIDHRSAWRAGRAAPDLADGPFDPLSELTTMNELAAAWQLHPEYESEGLAWELEEVARKTHLGTLTGRVVRDPRGHPIGWFLYFVNPGGVGEVVQLAARPADQGRIVAPLVAHARARGVVALAGRMEPQAASALASFGARLSWEGPWCLTHARDPRLLAAVLRGAGFISRMEGEWWLNF